MLGVDFLRITNTKRRRRFVSECWDWRREWDSNLTLALLLNKLLILRYAHNAKNATVANLRHVLGTRNGRHK